MVTTFSAIALFKLWETVISGNLLEILKNTKYDRHLKKTNVYSDSNVTIMTRMRATVQIYQCIITIIPHFKNSARDVDKRVIKDIRRIKKITNINNT